MAMVYLNTVEVGDPIPTLQKPPISRTQIARFAAASGDYGPLHVDEEVARASGYGSVFAHGMIALSYVGEMLDRWLENGRVALLRCNFRKFIWPGDVLIAKGVVVPKTEYERLSTVECTIWVQNQNNDKVLEGKAICLLFASAEAQSAAGKRRPDPVVVLPEYVSAHKRLEFPRSAAAASDKPPPRPPPKAHGTPVKIAVAEGAQADAAAPENEKKVRPPRPKEAPGEAAVGLKETSKLPPGLPKGKELAAKAKDAGKATKEAPKAAAAKEAPKAAATKEAPKAPAAKEAPKAAAAKSKTAAPEKKAADKAKPSSKSAPAKVKPAMGGLAKGSASKAKPAKTKR
jgi:acyl dehydratase